METEQVEQLASRMMQQSQMMQESANLIFHQMEGAPWQGGSKDEYLMQLADCRQRLLRYSQQMQDLQVALRAEEAQWIEAAAVFGSGVVAGGGASGGAGWQSWQIMDTGRSARLVKELLDFQNTETGKRLAREAAEAGLLFVIVDGGKVIARWGALGGKEIEIQWGEMEGSSGYFDPLENEIKLNQEMTGDDHIYGHTLIHEMQHAIDINKPNIDIEKINFVDNLTVDQASQMSPEQLEQAFADKYTEYTKTEVNAHDIGFEHEGNSVGDVLDRSDGMYTKEEFDFIINKRPYEETYESYINDRLKSLFGENTKYKADVWVDKNGQIQVDIDKSRPFIPRVIDSLDDPNNVINKIFNGNLI
jgi:hypothetical protein